MSEISYYDIVTLKMSIQELTKELKSKRYCRNCSENYPEKIEKLEKENKELKEKLGNTEVLLANAESDLKFEEERTNKLEKENEELKEKLQRYKDMEAKGLEEFKGVGGCWDCGIQLSADQWLAECTKYHQTLEEIRGIAEIDNMPDLVLTSELANLYNERMVQIKRIQETINKVLESEEE